MLEKYQRAISVSAARSMSADRSSIAITAAVEECIRRATVSVRYGALTISVPAEMARKALKALRRSTKRQKETAEDDRDRQEREVRQEREMREMREVGEVRDEREVEYDRNYNREEVREEVREDGGSGRESEKGCERGTGEGGEGGEKCKASRNWTVVVEAPTLADALDTLPKFRTVFAKETGDVSTGEIGGERKRIVMHATFACSRATLTPKSIKGATRLVSAEQRQRMAQNETHRLIQDGFREFAGV